MIALNFWLPNSAHPLAGMWLKSASAPTSEVIATIEVASRVMLGYHPSLRRECSAEEVPARASCCGCTPIAGRLGKSAAGHHVTLGQHGLQKQGQDCLGERIKKPLPGQQTH